MKIVFSKGGLMTVDDTVPYVARIVRISSGFVAIPNWGELDEKFFRKEAEAKAWLTAVYRMTH